MKGIFRAFARYVFVIFKEVLFTDRYAILLDTVHADQQGGHVIEYAIPLQSLLTPSFTSETEFKTPEFDTYASQLASLETAPEKLLTDTRRSTRRSGIRILLELDLLIRFFLRRHLFAQ
jgi:hypothetical protein